MTDKLQSGQQLNVNGELLSTNGLVKLVVQSDGNLVLYRAHFGILASRYGHPTPWASPSITSI